MSHADWCWCLQSDVWAGFTSAGPAHNAARLAPHHRPALLLARLRHPHRNRYVNPRWRCPGFTHARLPMLLSPPEEAASGQNLGFATQAALFWRYLEVPQLVQNSKSTPTIHDFTESDQLSHSAHAGNTAESKAQCNVNGDYLFLYSPMAMSPWRTWERWRRMGVGGRTVGAWLYISTVVLLCSKRPLFCDQASGFRP